MLFTPPNRPRDVDPWKTNFAVPFLGATPTQVMQPPSGPPVDATNPWMPGGEANFAASAGPNPNGNNIEDPFGQMFDPFNLPMWNGPYAAPITEGQFSALEGMKKTVNADPIGQSNDIMAAISRMLAGSGFASSGMDPNQAAARFRPNTGFTQSLDEASKTGFQTMEGYDPTNAGKSNALIDSITGERFDNTELFKNLDQLFEQDLAEQTAELQEQFSGLGLDVGSTDRLNKIASNAGGARAKFQVGKAGIAKESFDDQLNRNISLIPSIMANERLPFAEKMEFVRSVLEPAAARRMTATQTGVQTDENALDRVMQDRAMAERAREAALQASIASRGQDIDQRGQAMSGATNLFNAESVFRNAADDEVLRNINEFARTQGGGLEQMLAFIQSLSPQDVAVGPSTVSQGAGVVGDIFSAIPGIIDVLESIGAI